MQQYRLNYSLLIGLGVGSLVASGAVYGLWKFQIERKSDVLIAEADKAQESGDYRKAAQYYQHYLSIHGNDPETRVKLANSFADLLEKQDAAIEEVRFAVQVLEATAREIPEATDMKRRLVKVYGQMQQYQPALDHLNYLLDKYPNDAELQSLKQSYLYSSGSFKEAATYAYKLIGYDPKSKQFDEKAATAPHEVSVYSNLARILRVQDGKPELADQVMDQLVKVNPKSAEAYLARANYWLTAKEDARGQEDLQQAYKLDPENADVLLTLAEQASDDDEIDKALDYLAAGKKLHADDPRFYQATAGLQAKQEKYKEALAEIETGLKTVGVKKGGILLLYKAGLQLQNKDLNGVRDTIQEMKSAGFRPELIDSQEVRVLLAEEKWHDAMEELNRLRPRVANTTEIDFLLGLCYERLGSLELARDAYSLVVKSDPKNEPARLGLERVNATLDPEKVASESTVLPKDLMEELAKPVEEQNTAKVDEWVKDLAVKRKLEPFETKMMQVQIALMRKDYATARSLLKDADALKKKNLQVYLTLVTVTRLDPKQGPAKALEMWERLAKDKDFGDSPEMRLVKAEILTALNNEQLKPELISLLGGIDSWKPEEKARLWAGMSRLFLNLGMMDEAKQCLTLVADQRPNELPTRLGLFQLALDTDDDAGMEAAQKKVLQIVKDDSDPTYLFTEARRRLSQYRRGKLGPEALADIRRLISRALELRPEWHELWLANAELEVYANNLNLALDHYAKAEKMGRPRPLAVAQHIRLLVFAGRFKEAGDLLDRIPESMRQALLDNQYTEILFRTNKVEDAIREARAAAEAAPNNAQRQFVYGQLLARSAQIAEADQASAGSGSAGDRDRTSAASASDKQKARATEAIAAFRKAVELDPELADAWYGLIMLNAQQENTAAAEKALRDAQLALPSDNLQQFLAKSYEALGYWFDAETMYRAVYEADPADVRRAQQLAAFYLSPVYPRDDRQAKVTPLVNQILRAGQEAGPDGKPRLAANDSTLQWARRMAASVLAATKDYQNLLKAEKLLSSGSQEGMSIEDKLQMAQILAPRPEPGSRKKAIRLLEEVAAVQPLNEQADVTLGQLYYALGDWNKCRAQMQKAMGKHRKSLAARESYIDMLLSRNDPRYYNEAAEWLRSLAELAPGGRSTFALRVKLAKKQGNERAARADLLRLVPKIDDPTKLTDEQAEFLTFLGSLFVELDDLDNAEKLYATLAKRDPKLQFAFAGFLGEHRDVSRCFELLNQLYTPNRVNDVLGVALGTLRARRDEIGDKYDAQVEQWLNRAKLENPDSIAVQLLEADFYDVQKKYTESADIYRKLLARRDLTGFRRAVVLNNLAFLLALTGSSGDSGGLDPLVLVQEAEDILGPNTDILDTKAVVLIERKQFSEAIEELKLAVTDNPTGGKYFHMVVAHLGAGNNKAALDAWNQALAQGLTREELNRMEHSRYDEVKAKIEQLRAGASVSQNEAARRAK